MAGTVSERLQAHLRTLCGDYGTSGVLAALLDPLTEEGAEQMIEAYRLRRVADGQTAQDVAMEYLRRQDLLSRGMSAKLVTEGLFAALAEAGWTVTKDVTDSPRADVPTDEFDDWDEDDDPVDPPPPSPPSLLACQTYSAALTSGTRTRWTWRGRRTEDVPRLLPVTSFWADPMTTTRVRISVWSGLLGVLEVLLDGVVVLRTYGHASEGANVMPIAQHAVVRSVSPGTHRAQVVLTGRTCGDPVPLVLRVERV